MAFERRETKYVWLFEWKLELAQVQQLAAARDVRTSHALEPRSPAVPPIAYCAIRGGGGGPARPTARPWLLPAALNYLYAC